jgi:hypothetical protein
MAPVTLRQTRLAAPVSYLIALAIGILGVAYLLPLPAILGTGALWTSPSGDLAQNLTGHLAFQRPGWTLPALLAPALFWPHGLSIAMTDSNPLVSLLAKLLAMLRGHPANLFGFWFAACWLIQPIAAVYALRGMGSRSALSALAGAVLASIFPALLFRVFHINLCGQFTLLLALGLALRRMPLVRLTPRDWVPPCLLMIAAVLIHPYLFAFASAVLAAPALQGLLDRKRGAWGAALCFLVAAALPVLVFGLLSGTLGGGDRGFGFFSMNMVSPFWPQLSGLFGPTLPIIDPTGGEYEGFNYLGGGGLLLILMAVVALLRAPDRRGRFRLWWRRWRGLAIMLVCLTLLALTTNVYAGKYPVLLLGARPWDQVFGPLQSAGRAFWIVGYTLLLASVACLERRLPRGVLAGALALVLVLQWIDTGPLRASARAYFAGGYEARPAIALPPDLKLLTTLPVCMQEGPVTQIVATLRLAAIRQGALLSDVKTSRLPRWFNCETVMSDGTELPLADGEMRIFLTSPAIDLFRRQTLGSGTECRAELGMFVCTRGLPAPVGKPVPPGPPVPVLAAADPASPLQGAALAPYLSWGWKRGPDGLHWSEGPRATLLFQVPALMPIAAGPRDASSAAGPRDAPIAAGPRDASSAAGPRDIIVRLTLDGVATDAGGKRPVVLRVGQGAPVDVNLLVHPRDAPDGIVRIAIDIFHPIDPTKRRLAAPVGRAGVRLRALQVEGEPAQARPAG